MVTFQQPFSGFSVDDVEAARAFYVNVLGLATEDIGDGMFGIALGDGHHVLVYPKGEEHRPAEFTVLNLPVADVGAAVAELSEKGVEFLKYEGAPQDEAGVMRGYGPDIAWFTDPAGNVLSIIAG